MAFIEEHRCGPDRLRSRAEVCLILVYVNEEAQGLVFGVEL